MRNLEKRTTNNSRRILLKKLEDKGYKRVKKKNLEIQSYNDVLSELDKLENQEKSKTRPKLYFKI